MVHSSFELIAVSCYLALYKKCWDAVSHESRSWGPLWSDCFVATLRLTLYSAYSGGEWTPVSLGELVCVCYTGVSTTFRRHDLLWYG